MSILPCHDRQPPHPCALRPPRSAFTQRLVDGAGCSRPSIAETVGSGDLMAVCRNRFGGGRNRDHRPAGAGMTASHDLLTLRNSDRFPVLQRYGPVMP